MNKYIDYFICKVLIKLAKNFIRLTNYIILIGESIKSKYN